MSATKNDKNECETRQKMVMTQIYFDDEYV